MDTFRKLKKKGIRITRSDKVKLILMSEQVDIFSKSKSKMLNYLLRLLDNYPYLRRDTVSCFAKYKRIVADIKSCDKKIGPSSSDTKWASSQTIEGIHKYMDNPNKDGMVVSRTTFYRLCDKIPETHSQSTRCGDFRNGTQMAADKVFANAVDLLETWSTEYGLNEMSNNTESDLKAAKLLIQPISEEPAAPAPAAPAPAAPANPYICELGRGGGLAHGLQCSEGPAPPAPEPSEDSFDDASENVIDFVRVVSVFSRAPASANPYVSELGGRRAYCLQ